MTNTVSATGTNYGFRAKHGMTTWGIMGREKILENSLKKMSGFGVYYCGNKVKNLDSN